VKVEVHADLQAFDEARWNGLLDRARLPSVFLTWQWQTEWSRAFAAERPKQILAATDAAGELAGLLPLYEETPGRWRILGGVDVSDYLDLIAPAGREEEVWAALLAHCAAHRAEWDLHGIRAASATATVVPARCWRCPRRGTSTSRSFPARTGTSCGGRSAASSASCPARAAARTPRSRAGTRP
jgi:hypothetical protein